MELDNPVIRESGVDRLYTIINYVVLSGFLLMVLYPLLFILSASFSSAMAVVSGKVWLWPVEPTLDGYTAIFKSNKIISGFANSLFYTAFGTMLNVFMTILAGYPLSRKDFFGKNFFMMMLVFTIMFSGGLIPTFLLVRDLGMLNTRWAMIIPTALTVWNVIITRTYFKITIPDEMLEAAQIDGCNDFKFLTRMVIPLSGPIVAVMFLFYAVSHWNRFFDALIYLNRDQLYPLQLVLRSILIQNSMNDSMLSDVKEAIQRESLRELLKYSLIVVSTFPLLIVYPFVQRHFVKGIMIGSLKG